MNARILIAGSASGSGKTFVTCGILAMLKNLGICVAPFKCGPDYIDPAFHQRVLGRESTNLDTFFFDSATTNGLLLEKSKGADLSVIEGVMGYYDGVAGITTKASAYDLATQTKTPVVLVVNCKGMSTSILAQIKGFMTYQENSQIKAVILNQISAMLYPRIKRCIEEQLNITVVGFVPPIKDFTLQSRHLGLVLPNEIEDFSTQMRELGERFSETISAEMLLKVANNAPEIKDTLPLAENKYPVHIAVAKDEAFCFIYPDNIHLLEKMGAKISYFSPLRDKKLPPDINGVILYGGYPELHAKTLAGNVSLLKNIKEEIENGLPFFAECGGFMYLHEKMQDNEGNSYPMVGVIEGEAYKTDKLTRFGYITLEGNTFFDKDVGDVPAHSFHYFQSTNVGNAFIAKKPSSIIKWETAHVFPNGYAGFPHIHFYANPKICIAFLEKCLERKNNYANIRTSS